MIRAVFFDVDNTLYSHKMHCIPASALRALEALHGSGIRIFLATGRSCTELSELGFDSLTFDGYVTLNGQLCLGEEKDVIFSKAFCGKDRDLLLDVFRRKTESLVLSTEKTQILNYAGETIVHALRAVNTPLPRISEYNSEDFFMATLYCRQSKRPLFLDEFSEARITQWRVPGYVAYDIVRDDGGKAEGIRQMLKHFNLTSEEISAFGDGENDIDMLRLAGFSVAMGDAEEPVRLSSDYLAQGIDEDGILHALLSPAFQEKLDPRTAELLKRGLTEL